MYELYMEITNPTEAFTGKKESIQGFAIHGNTGFVLFHTGICAAYDLSSCTREPIGVFRLGSYNTGDPDVRYTNHANDAMFGPTLEGEKYPLLYVTAGNSGETDENGYISYCAVEQIREKDGVFTAETVQRIYYRNDGIDSTPFVTPGWGWPASLVDVQGGWYYMFSARHRTKKEFTRPDNTYIITKFPLPTPGTGDVTLHSSDIVDQFELPLYALFTQGGTIRDGKLWYLFGAGKEKYPDALCCIDLQARDFVLREDLSGTIFGDQEVECCAFLGDSLLINTQNGNIYLRR
ncbi:MAG: hypothetical protein E7463_05275 [Ruminococcaceae bacterium]|nr:hypothetical protein [Oscillospiraceae bacterium]